MSGMRYVPRKGYENTLAAKTVSVSDLVMVDLDEAGEVIGVEYPETAAVDRNRARGQVDLAMEAVTDLHTEVLRLRAQRDAVLAMHKRETRYWGHGVFTKGGRTTRQQWGEHDVCATCSVLAEVAWPCPTARALGVEA